MLLSVILGTASAAQNVGAIGEAEGRHVQALKGAIADAQHKMAERTA